MKWMLLSLCIVVVLAIVAAVGLMLWLTPERGGRLVSEALSKELDADVKIGSVRFTLFSSFPRFYAEADSVLVVSRAFDNLPDSLAGKVPAGGRELLHAGKLRGTVNVPGLLRGRILLGDVEVERLGVHLVALTDSLANYDIIPSVPKGKTPYFHIKSLKLKNPGLISFTSVPTGSRATLRLAQAELEEKPGNGKRERETRDRYRLAFGGKVDVMSGNLEVLRGFPIGLGGDVEIRFRPFGIKTGDYAVVLGKINGKMDLDLEVGEESANLNLFSYRVAPVNLRDILALIPGGGISLGDRLRADLLVEADARLLSPYSFSSAYLPDLEVHLGVADGAVSYRSRDGRTYRAVHRGVGGKLVFDGHDPSASYVDVPGFEIEGEGVRVNAKGRVTGITGTPRIEAALRGDADMERLARAVPALSERNARGNIEWRADMTGGWKDGDLADSHASLRVSGRALSLREGGCDIKASSLELETAEGIKGGLSGRGIIAALPRGVTVRLKGVEVVSPTDSLRVALSHLAVSGDIDPRDAGEEGVLKRFAVNVSNDSAILVSGGDRYVFAGFKGSLKGRRNGVRKSAAAFRMPGLWMADSVSQRLVPHTPVLVEMASPAWLRSMLATWGGEADLSIAEASMAHSGFNLPAELKGFSLHATPDSVSLKHLELRAGKSRAVVSGGVGNLCELLMSGEARRIPVSLNAELDTMQLNQLARAWAQAHPGSAIARGDKAAMGGAEAYDTLCMLIPRNIEARVRVTARQTRYINLHLYDLDTRLRVKDGRLNVDTLGIDADFGQASLRFCYDTSDIQDMGMQMEAGIDSIDIVKLMANFGKLEKAMPALANLSGDFSAGVAAKVNVFPDNYINIPSLYADAHVNGLHLQLKQNEFVRRVTRMLMLPGDEVLHFRNLRIHAGVHDNLLEVFPFRFGVGRYDLRMEGVNNFNGDLYYHIGVYDWPLRIPFGINIKGDYHHPQLRFGGKKWKDSNGARITGGVEDSNRVNLLRQARSYGGEFVHSAASYSGD